jgi:hypothetical protein
MRGISMVQEALATSSAWRGGPGAGQDARLRSVVLGGNAATVFDGPLRGDYGGLPGC